MLIPKKLKYRKSHRLRGAFKGVAQKGNKIAFGSYAIKAQTMAEITSRQIEAARRAMTRYIKRGGKIWIRIFPHQPITQKAAEVPMGSGKGNVRNGRYRRTNSKRSYAPRRPQTPMQDKIYLISRYKLRQCLHYKNYEN